MSIINQKKFAKHVLRRFESFVNYVNVRNLFFRERLIKHWWQWISGDLNKIPVWKNIPGILTRGKYRIKNTDSAKILRIHLLIRFQMTFQNYRYAYFWRVFILRYISVNERMRIHLIYVIVYVGMEANKHLGNRNLFQPVYAQEI